MEELEIGMAEPSLDLRGFHNFLYVSDTTGTTVKSIREELSEMEEYEEESTDHSDKIIYESKGPCTDNSYSPPRMRSGGLMPKFSNVQGRIKEHERKTKARRAITRD